MRLSFIHLLFVFFVIPSSGFSGPADPVDAGPYNHLHVTGYFTPGGSVTGKIVGVGSPGTQPVELFIGRSLRTPPLYTMYGAFHVKSILSHKSLGPIPAGGVLEIPATLPMIAFPYDLYIQAAIGQELSNLFVMEARESAPSGMVLIPEGEYDMGDHHDGYSDALPLHNVKIDAFLMDIHEVTNRQYCDFLNSAYGKDLIEVTGGQVFKKNGTEMYCETTSSSPYSRITWSNGVFGIERGKSDHPMVMVSWYGAAAYANWRSGQSGLKDCYNLKTWECNFGAGGYRLPTEAEWEKAARGGEETPYYRYPWGNTIGGSHANSSNSGDPYEAGASPCTTPVEYYCGSQVPPGVDMANGYGLYDMSGNVWEWCNDWYDGAYYKYCALNGIFDNPTGPVKGTDRVLRGGSWVYSGSILGCACRHYHLPLIRSHCYGFRLVRD